MKIVTWNVDGLRACEKNGFINYAATCGADVILIQETKLNDPLPTIESIVVPGKPKPTTYGAAWNFSNRKGYSGTLCLYLIKPLSIAYGMCSPLLDTEGRVITLEYANHYIVNVYVPNSQGSLARKYYRAEWDKAFCEYVCGLQEKMPVIIGGDFNVARQHIDIYPENKHSVENPPGFTDEERDGIERLISHGFVDVFRHFYPQREGVYTWWSNRRKMREHNCGWRLDYFLVSESLMSDVKGIAVRDDVLGSDHCPVELILNGK